MAIIKAIAPPTRKEFPLQSIEVPNTKGPGQTAKWLDQAGELGRVTLPELFESGLAQANDLPFLGHRAVLTTEPTVTFAPEYTWQTYAEVDKRRRAVGSALESYFKSGKLQKGSDFEAVGIWAVNRPEWQITDLACQAYNKVSVALYDTLGPDAVEYAINHSEVRVIFCSSDHIQALLDNAAVCPVLKMMVSFDPLDVNTKKKYAEAGKQNGIDLKEYREVEEDGEKNFSEPIKATLDQVALICYSSGTTGTPKGAVLTHKNLATAVLGYIHGLPSMPERPIMFSYLPLAHIYGRCFELCITAIGGRIGYYTGNPLNLLSDAQALKPHLFPAVPRALKRIYMGAMLNARAPGIKDKPSYLFRRAVATKLANLHSTGSTRHALWDRVVFKKIQAVLGGQVHCISSGAAPINAAISFVGCEVLEGYALTEACAFGTRTWSDDDAGATGTIGGAAVFEEIKLVDVPELGYTSDDKPNPRGELCFKGDNVFSGYYKDEKQTAEAIDKDGWFHTGDVAELDECGTFKIIDRVKNIMKLSQGEYVALQKLEN
ncbi:hypothetical protein FS837_004766, partial [Tulasnella sp. UAMH 9824]